MPVVPDTLLPGRPPFLIPSEAGGFDAGGLCIKTCTASELNLLPLSCCLINTKHSVCRCSEGVSSVCHIRSFLGLDFVSSALFGIQLASFLS